MGSITTFPESQAPAPNMPVMLGYGQVVADQTGKPAAGSTITGLSVTVTVPEGRRVRLTAHGLIRNDTAGAQCIIRFSEAGTLFGYSSRPAHTASNTEVIHLEHVLTPTAGRHTYEVWIGGGSGTLMVRADPAFPFSLSVEDITGLPAPVTATSVPVGQLGYGSMPAQISNIVGTLVNLNASVNVTVPAGRTLRITASISGYSSVGTDVLHLAIAKNGTATWGKSFTAQPGGWGIGMDIDAIDSPAAGTHTYSLQLRRDTGTGSVTAQNGWIMVEDITSTPAPANSAPSSTLGYVENFANAQVVTAYADLTGGAITVTVGEGRRLRITGRAHLYGSVADDRAILDIREGTTVLQGAHFGLPVPGQGIDGEVMAVVTPSAGTHTYKLSAGRANGTGSVTVYSALGDSITSLLIEDITPASIQPSAIVPGAIVANSSARPSSPVVGTQIYEPDTGLTRVWNGSAWNQIVPIQATAAARPASPTAGTVIYETDTGLLKTWNGSNWVTQGNFKWHANGSPLVGAPPAVDTGSLAFKMQGGTAVNSTNASGDVTITYPVAFPNGLMVVMVIQGDNTHAGATFITHSAGLSAFAYRMYNASGAAWANSGNHRVNWLAIGW